MCQVFLLLVGLQPPVSGAYLLLTDIIIQHIGATPGEMNRGKNHSVFYYTANYSSPVTRCNTSMV